MQLFFDLSKRPFNEYSQTGHQMMPLGVRTNTHAPTHAPTHIAGCPASYVLPYSGKVSQNFTVLFYKNTHSQLLTNTAASVSGVH